MSTGPEDYETIETTWERHGSELGKIRFAVFVEEQGFPSEIELDGRDDECAHVLCRHRGGKVVGTGRLLPDGHIGRIAVLSEVRGQGLGAAITALLVDMARARKFDEVVLHSQIHAMPFYARLGFEPFGERFDEAGAPHQGMRIQLG